MKFPKTTIHIERYSRKEQESFIDECRQCLKEHSMGFRAVARIHCVICNENFDDQPICNTCLGKLALEKCSHNLTKDEYHLVWKSVEDKMKYPSIVHARDIHNALDKERLFDEL